MSLYIGNLSPRVDQEELERVFGRFGRCTIKLKDGYGFAVYGIRAQAEVAIRALRGRNICGLPVSLSWSNKQPGIGQPFNRGGRPYEMQQGRGFVRRDDHMNGPLRPNARPPYKFRHPEGNPRRLEESNDLQVEGGSFDNVVVEQEHNSPKEDVQDTTGKVDHKLLDSGRWGEQFGRMSNDSHIDDGTTFDRYKPDGENERTDLDGNNAMLHDMSPGKEISEDKFRREEAVDLALGPRNSTRKNQACFKCGNLGHFMRDCPLQDASRERKLDRLNDRRGSAVNSRDRGKIEEGAQPSSRRRLSSTSAKERVRGRKDSGSGRLHRLKRPRSPPMSTEYDDNGKAHGRRKRSEDGKEAFKGRHGKRTRRSLSRSRSRSSSTSSSRSSSRSRSPVLYSSSSSLSDSKSNQPKSRRVKSRFKSRSSSPSSLSLSVSIGKPLSPPPDKTEVKLNGPCDISSSMPTKPDVIQGRQHFEIVAEEESIGCENTAAGVQPNLPIMKESQQPEVASKEDNIASGDTGVAAQVEDMFVCVDVQDDVKIDNLQKNDDQYLAESRMSCDGNDQNTTIGREHSTFGSPSRILREESEVQILGIESCVPMKSDLKTASSTRANRTSISLEELDRVTKHYNLKHTEENGGHLSVEDYFGCARLWPWEIIYYRRLKKGPISVENYARRLAQNKEFGIADKYVRSSSGWGEPTQELNTKDFASS